MKKYIVCLLLLAVVCDNHILLAQVIQSKKDSCVIPASLIPRASLSLGASAADTPPRLRMAYIIPANRTQQTNAIEKLQFTVMLIQSWYKEQMKINGFGEKTFNYEIEPGTNKPKINIVNSTNNDAYFRGSGISDLYNRNIAVCQGAGFNVWSANEVWLIVSESHLMNANSTFTGDIGLGGSNASGSDGGVAIIGSNYLPFLDRMFDLSDYNNVVVPDFGAYPLKQTTTFGSGFPSFGSLASNYIGSIAHQLGHAFGLVSHDNRNEYTGSLGNIMGAGYKLICGSMFPALFVTNYNRLEYSGALYLNTSHYFNSGKSVTDKPVVTISTTSPVSLSSGQLNIAFRASDGDSLASAWLMYDGVRVAEMKLKDTTVNMQFVTPYYTMNQTKTYQIWVIDKEGNKGETSVDLKVSQTSANKAPVPVLYTTESAPQKNDVVSFLASRTTDANHTLSQLQVQWDIDNDGTYDTGWLAANTAYTKTFVNAGNYLVKMKVKDPSNAVSVSTPIPLRVSNTSGSCRFVSPPVIAGATEICAGTSTVLKTFGCPGTIQWSTGATTAQVTVSPTVNIIYTALCDLGDNCVSAASSIAIQVKPFIDSLVVVEVFNTSAVLSWKSDNSTAYTIIYRQVGATDWIASETTPYNSKNITNLTANTSYEWRVKGDCGVFSAIDTFATNGLNPPCQPTFANGCDGYGISLDGVKVGDYTLSQQTGCSAGAYHLFAEVVPTLLTGHAYNFTLNFVSLDNGIQSVIWIDWNKDGTFDASEKVFSTTVEAKGSQTGSFSIPGNVPTINGVKMRVVVNFADSFSDPCGAYNYGETEDYLVNISNTCASSIVLQSTADDYSNGIINKKASAISGDISASNTITGTANVQYEALKIFLNPGFTAETGTVFVATVGGCNE